VSAVVSDTSLAGYFDVYLVLDAEVTTLFKLGGSHNSFVQDSLFTNTFANEVRIIGAQTFSITARQYNLTHVYGLLLRPYWQNSMSGEFLFNAVTSIRFQ